MTKCLDRGRIRVAGTRPSSRGCQSGQVSDRHDVVRIAVDQQDRARYRAIAAVALMSATTCLRGPQVDAGREPGERVGDRIGDGQAGQPERLAGESVGVGRRRGRDDGGDARVGGAGQDRPDRPHRVAGDRAARHLGTGEQRLERRQRIEPELAGAQRQFLGGIRTVAADVDRQAVEAGRMQEQRERQRPVAGRLPAVDEHDAGARFAASEPG